jgi:hypothetical protein
MQQQCTYSGWSQSWVPQGWDKTESTWNVGHCWPIVPAPDDGCWWVWSSRWDEKEQVKPTRRLRVPVPRCPPQIPHVLIWARTLADAVGSQRLTVQKLRTISDRQTDGNPFIYTWGGGGGWKHENTSTSRYGFFSHNHLTPSRTHKRMQISYTSFSVLKYKSIKEYGGSGGRALRIPNLDDMYSVPNIAVLSVKCMHL